MNRVYPVFRFFFFFCCTTYAPAGLYSEEQPTRAHGACGRKAGVGRRVQCHIPSQQLHQQGKHRRHEIVDKRRAKHIRIRPVQDATVPREQPT